MVTVEELLAQIKSLEKQLKTLKATDSNSTIFKSSLVKGLLAQIKSLQKQLNSLKTAIPELKDPKPSLIGEQFYKELSEARQSGIKVINRGQDKKIELNFENALSSEDIENVLADLNEYEIEIIDCQKIKEQEKIVRRKYKDKSIPGGAMGGIPPDGWIYLAAYPFYVVFKWSLKHILDDADQLLWDKFRGKFASLYRLLTNKKSGEKNSFTVVASYKIFEDNQPTILFTFPAGISEIELEKELNNMAEIFNKTLNDYFNGDKSISVFEFTYDLSTKKWNLKTQKKFDI